MYIIYNGPPGKMETVDWYTYHATGKPIKVVVGQSMYIVLLEFALVNARTLERWLGAVLYY